MKILITGGSGFIGRNLTKYLSRKPQHDIISIIFNTHKVETSKGEKVYSVDLTKEKDVDYLFKREKPDGVFDLASISGGFRFLEENITRVLRENMLMNLNVLEAAVKYKVPKILFASSSCVYPTHKIEKQFIEEDAYPINSENLYGLQKIYMENTYKEYAKKYPIEIYLPRLDGIFGPFTQYQGIKAQGLANLCYKIISLENNGSIELFGNGKQMRDYLYVDDCIEAMLALINSNYHQPINISHGQPQELDSFINKICKILDKKIIVNYSGENVGVTTRTISNRLAKEIINWEPTTKIENGLEKMINWMKEEMKL